MKVMITLCPCGIIRVKARLKLTEPPGPTEVDSPFRAMPDGGAWAYLCQPLQLGNAVLSTRAAVPEGGLVAPLVGVGQSAHLQLRAVREVYVPTPVLDTCGCPGGNPAASETLAGLGGGTRLAHREAGGQSDPPVRGLYPAAGRGVWGARRLGGLGGSAPVAGAQVLCQRGPCVVGVSKGERDKLEVRQHLMVGGVIPRGGRAEECPLLRPMVRGGVAVKILWVARLLGVGE